MLYDSAPTVAAEVKVDFNDYVPEGFGTCENLMIGGDTLSITDYKHGKGVPVSAVGNPQMRLYALGALKRYAPIFGDTIKKVRMSIDQPRLQRRQRRRDEGPGRDLLGHDAPFPKSAESVRSPFGGGKYHGAPCGGRTYSTSGT